MVAKSMTCCVDGCNDKVVKRGYCYKHYKRFMRHGDPLKGGVFRGKLDRTKQCSTDGCTNGVDVAYSALCNACYLRQSRNGSVVRRRVRKGVPLRWLCCLSRGVEKCIIFPYGNVQLDGFRQEYPARIVCELFNGPSEGLFALHLCGNGHLGCVNPDHIVWGDQKENADHRSIHKKFGKGSDICLLMTQTKAKSTSEMRLALTSGVISEGKR